MMKFLLNVIKLNIAKSTAGPLCAWKEEKSGG